MFAKEVCGFNFDPFGMLHILNRSCDLDIRLFDCGHKFYEAIITFITR